MLNIGMLGSESFHTKAFAKALQQIAAQEHLDLQVSHIWGWDSAYTRHIAAEYAIPHVTAQPQDMLGQVQAVMVLVREGYRHMPLAEPFLQAGLPVFVDKPFTDTLPEAQSLVRLAQSTGSVLYGGSMCPYLPEVSALKHALQTAEQPPSHAELYFPADWDCPHRGLLFYGIHLAELCIELFGTAYTTVSTVRCGEVVSAVVEYPHTHVVLNFIKDLPQGFASVCIDGIHCSTSFALDMCYQHGMEAFAHALPTKTPLRHPSFYLAGVGLMRRIIDDCKQVV